jgi:SAM-dependent methyltransferase
MGSFFTFPFLSNKRKRKELENANKRDYLATLPDRLSAWDRFALPLPVDGVVDIACPDCPKFDAQASRCSIPYGSPIRKCITASTEFFLRDLRGKDMLEVGCGESSVGKLLAEMSGGRWIGLDPRAGKGSRASLRAVGGVVQKLPFRDCSFDVIYGNQTIEHWGEFAGSRGVPRVKTYNEILGEIWRVLKPGGWAYFDAPIHLHGVREFVIGDLAAIRSMFAAQAWKDLSLVSWRRRHEPLPPYFVPVKDKRRTWSVELAKDTPEFRKSLEKQSVWVLSLKAGKAA